MIGSINHNLSFKDVIDEDSRNSIMESLKLAKKTIFVSTVGSRSFLHSLDDCIDFALENDIYLTVGMPCYKKISIVDYMKSYQREDSPTQSDYETYCLKIETKMKRANVLANESNSQAIFNIIYFDLFTEVTYAAVDYFETLDSSSVIVIQEVFSKTSANGTIKFIQRYKKESAGFERLRKHIKEIVDDRKGKLSIQITNKSKVAHCHECSPKKSCLKPTVG
jgi:hypothetical protein